MGRPSLLRPSAPTSASSCRTPPLRSPPYHDRHVVHRHQLLGAALQCFRLHPVGLLIISLECNRPSSQADIPSMTYLTHVMTSSNRCDILDPIEWVRSMEQIELVSISM